MASYECSSLAIIILIICASLLTGTRTLNYTETDPTSKLEQQLRSRERSCQSSLVPGRLSDMTADVKVCSGQFDGFLCWPSAAIGSKISLPCPADVFAINASANRLATRRCLAGGRWQLNIRRTDFHPLTDYSECLMVGGAKSAIRLYNLMQLTKVSNRTQQMRLRVERIVCLGSRQAGNPSSSARVPTCGSVFDGVLCWPPQPAGTLGRQPCPDYLNEVQRDGFASRLCQDNGTWQLGGWTNFTDCLPAELAAAAAATGTIADGSEALAAAKMHLAIMSKIGLVGHSLSLATLLIAIVILASFRRLHCRRNCIHINLYTAFGLRAISHFVNRALPSNNATLMCRLNQSLMTFTVIGSFTWVFVEALHLYMLIFVNAMSEERLSTAAYIGIGWGLTCTVTAAWVLLRLLLDNRNCWREYRPLGPDIWLLNVYLALLVVLNAVLFAKIVRELFIKLKRQSASDVSTMQPYVKLWKSTCLLILVFGIYYIIFLPVAMVPKDRLGETLDIVHLYYEHFFNSFQGFFAALLFCFVNSDVRHELHRQARKLQLAAWLAPGNSRRRVATKSRANSRNNGSHGNDNSGGSQSALRADWSQVRVARRRGQEERRQGQPLSRTRCASDGIETQEIFECVPLQRITSAGLNGLRESEQSPDRQA